MSLYFFGDGVSVRMGYKLQPKRNPVANLIVIPFKSKVFYKLEVYKVQKVDAKLLIMIEVFTYSTLMYLEMAEAVFVSCLRTTLLEVMWFRFQVTEQFTQGRSYSLANSCVMLSVTC